MTDQTIEAEARAALAFTHPTAGVAKRPDVSPIDDAVGYVDDRQNRVDYQLDELAQVVARLTDRLMPAMTDGQPVTYPSDTELAPSGPGTPEDHRSTIAKRIHGFGLTAQRQGDTLADRVRQITGIIDALEV